MNTLTLTVELAKVKSELNEVKQECEMYKLKCENQDNETIVAMLGITEVYEMVITNAPTTLNLKNGKDETIMVEVYVTLILKGKKTLNQVPTPIRKEVEAMLNDLEVTVK